MSPRHPNRAPGAGSKCPRCGGPKPCGTCGKGIALSRRGRAYICTVCATEEALLDAKILTRKSHVYLDAMAREAQLIGMIQLRA